MGLDWLPADEPQEASCAFADGTIAAAVGVAVLLIGAVVTAARSGGVAWLLPVAVLVLLVRVASVRVTVSPTGLISRGVWRSRAVTWPDVVALAVVRGPVWLRVLDWTYGSPSAIEIRVAGGGRFRPLPLTYLHVVRSQEQVLRLTRRFADIH